jgi:putative tricarboxylic transport membrane protein
MQLRSSMMNRRTTTHLSLALSCLTAVALAGCGGGGDAPSAQSGEWTPARNVTMVVPYAPGGGSDAFARVVASGIEEVEPNLTVTVENHEGGSGAVGVEYFRSLRGDAQSLLAGSTPIAIPGSATADFTLLDYTPLAMLAEDTTALVAPAAAPFNNCSEMLDAAGSRRIVAGTSGDFTIDGILARLVARTGNVNFDNVPFESGGEIISALLGDQVQVGFVNLGEATGQVKSGDIKVLCTTGETRYPYAGFENVPTASEQGIDVGITQYRAVIAPPGVAPAQSEYWVDVLKRVYDTEQFKQYLTNRMLTGRLLTGEEFRTYVSDQEKIIAEVIR